jgi:hypothetical protein
MLEKDRCKVRNFGRGRFYPSMPGAQTENNSDNAAHKRAKEPLKYKTGFTKHKASITVYCTNTYARFINIFQHT